MTTTETMQITVSMDGLRRNMGNALHALKRDLDDMFERQNPETEEAVKNAFDEVSQFIGALYCIYDEDVKNFSNMSDVDLPCYWKENEDGGVE